MAAFEGFLRMPDIDKAREKFMKEIRKDEKSDETLDSQLGFTWALDINRTNACTSTYSFAGEFDLGVVGLRVINDSTNRVKILVRFLNGVLAGVLYANKDKEFDTQNMLTERKRKERLHLYASKYSFSDKTMLGSFVPTVEKWIKQGKEFFSWYSDVLENKCEEMKGKGNTPDYFFLFAHPQLIKQRYEKGELTFLGDPKAIKEKYTWKDLAIDLSENNKLVKAVAGKVESLLKEVPKNPDDDTACLEFFLFLKLFSVGFLEAYLEKYDSYFYGK